MPGPDRVVNIDETSRCIRSGEPPRRESSPEGNAKESTTFTIAFSMDRGPLDLLVQIVHAGKTNAVLPEKPWPERTRHVTSENGWATTTTILQLAASLDDVMNPSKEGQSWIFLWDMAGIHASEATLAAMKAAFSYVVLCFIPLRSTSYLQPCDVAILRSHPPQLQELHPDAGERHSCPLRPRWHLGRLGHEQSMAAPVFGRMGSSCSHGLV